MGMIWSRFRKKESTKEKLRKLHEEIKSLEEYKEYTEQRRKKLVGSLVAYSIFFYLLAALICYFYYLPPTLQERLLYATPFIGFIVIIYLIKKLLTCYYRWKVRRNEDHLASLKEKKVEILDQVMENETYKVAKDILELYAPETIRKSTLTIKSPLVTPVGSSQRMSHQGGEVRRRIITPQMANLPQRPSPQPNYPLGPSSSFSIGRLPVTPHISQQQVVRPNLSSSHHQGPRIMYSSISPKNSQPFVRPEGSGVQSSNYQRGGELSPGPPMPRPILPRERGILDRFVEYLVGDGPSNRYALVCRQCESHNGMALKDEFPYIAFRCAYCFYWNPARKQKPTAPKLETSQPSAYLDLQRKVMLNDEDSSLSDEDEDEEETESESSSDANPSSEEGKRVVDVRSITDMTLFLAKESCNSGNKKNESETNDENEDGGKASASEGRGDEAAKDSGNEREKSEGESKLANDKSFKSNDEGEAPPQSSPSAGGDQTNFELGSKTTDA